MDILAETLKRNEEAKLLRRFADAYRSGAHGASIEADDAKALAEAIDSFLNLWEIIVRRADYKDVIPLNKEPSQH